jgi:MFS transporter, OFA family, oxalate/formate antiporter
VAVSSPSTPLPAPSGDDAGGGVPAAPPPWPGFYYGYWILGGAFLSQLIVVGMMTSVVGTFVRPMTTDLGWHTSQFFAATALSRFVTAGMGFVVGTYVDRWGVRRFQLVGAVILGIGLASAGSVTELWQWWFIRGIVFTAGAAMVGNLVVNVTMSKWWVTKRGRMIGFSSMGVSLAGVIFPRISVFLIDEFGWQMAWRLLGVIAVAIVVPVAFIMRRQPEDHGWLPDGLTEDDDETSPSSIQRAAVRADFDNSFTRAEALRTRALYLIVFAFGFGGVGIQVSLVQMIPYLEDSGFSSAAAATLIPLMSFAALVCKPFWGWTTDHWEPARGAAVAFIMAGTGLGIIVFAASANMMIPMLLGLVVLGWGFGGQIPLQETIWGSYFGRRHIGQVRSVAMPISLFIGAGSPMVVALYRDHVGSYTGVFLGVAGCWVLAAIIVMFVTPPARPVRVPTGSPATTP